MTSFWYAYIAIGALLALVAMFVAEKPDRPTPVLTFILTLVIFIAIWPLSVIIGLRLMCRRRNAKP